jgi:AAA15 family ATPase/GTPase
MLTKFEVQNFKNFKENFIFDLSATKYEFNPECIDNGVVKKGLIYGANGGGKSNLGFAIFDLVSHLTDKEFDHDHYNRNYLNAESKDELARFKYIFTFDSSVIEYSYGKKSTNLTAYETLKINEKEVVKYTRGKPLSIKLKGTETLNPDLGGSKLSALKYIKSNAVLDKRNKTNRTLEAFFSFVDKMLFFRSLNFNDYIGYETGSTLVDQDILKRGHLEEFESFLNEAGITCKLRTIETNGKREIAFVFGDKTINFYEAASTGTLSLALFYFWLQRLRENNEVSFVFIDEFDAFYHHKLSTLIVNELKKITSQVILTTHNTSIMSNDILRPDCYFIMQNNQIKPLYKFTDKELRNAHNIEKMYRAGAFNV